MKHCKLAFLNRTALSRVACASTLALFVIPASCKSKKTSTSSTREVPYKDTPGKIKKGGYLVNPSDTSCGGYPMLWVESMPGTCVGLVKHLDDTKFQPRVPIEIPGKPGQFLITDFAGWDPKAGKIWLLQSKKIASDVILTPIVKGLSVPHQIAVGPENHIYFAEDSRIRAFPISAIQGNSEIPTSAIRDILTGLPGMFNGDQKNSMHPLKHFAFDAQFNLYVNVGAYTDHCSDFLGKTCLEADISFGTAGSPDIRNHGAVLRKYTFKGSLSAGWDPNYQVIAQGLRNSMGLLFTSKGDLIQVENGRDFPESSRPFEELNVISASDLRRPKSAPPHYGWPYCYNFNEKSDEWKNFSFSCDPQTNSNYRAPHVFLPPHSAPLGLMRYTGSMFPNLKNKLIVPLHGYRSAGHRIIAFKTDANTELPLREGKGSFRDDDMSGGTTAFERQYPEQPPAAFSEEVISGWYDAPGYRPRGAPVAIAQASDGSIWMADDKANAILRLAVPNRESQALPRAPRPNLALAYTQLTAELPAFKKAYDALVTKVIRSPQCEGCHDNYTNMGDSTADGLHYMRYILAMGNWAVPGDLKASTLFTKMDPPGKSAMPPIDKPYPNLQTATEALETVRAFVMAMPAREKLWRVKTSAKPVIRGLKRGAPGNSECGTLLPGYHVQAVSNSAATLGGQKMLEIVVGKPSALVKETACASYDAFYVAQADLEKLFE
jgi:glucose/arabinose dehydrogenase